jgi:hypothetical protein
MKKSLLFLFCCVILYFTGSSLYGQIIVLSENFSGFTSGSHLIPSNSDASATLDSKTQVAGWSGFKIYPAGGEIKVGIETTPGWIETPPADLSLNEGHFTVKFDICRWPNDATSVQVYLNGTAIGPILSPSDDFQTIQISGTGGTTTGRIKIQAIAKRFFLDNFSIITENVPTGLIYNEKNGMDIMIYPNPVNNQLTISNMQNINQIEILNTNGTVLKRVSVETENDLQIGVEELRQGIYFISFNSGDKIIVRRFIKL